MKYVQHNRSKYQLILISHKGTEDEEHALLLFSFEENSGSLWENIF